MAKYRQHNVSAEYAHGVDAALEQLANNGMGFPGVEPGTDPEYVKEFFKGYKDTLSEHGWTDPRR